MSVQTTTSNGPAKNPEPKPKKPGKKEPEQKEVLPLTDDDDDIQGFGSDIKLFGPENGD